MLRYVRIEAGVLKKGSWTVRSGRGRGSQCGTYNRRPPNGRLPTLRVIIYQLDLPSWPNIDAAEFL